MSYFANNICGVPQGSVLGPLKLCLYLLPMSAILKYHTIGYHVCADNTQLYILFKCKQPLEAISKVNSCLSDIRRWMITNKLKINDSKTEFRCDLSGLSVNVGESVRKVSHSTIIHVLISCRLDYCNSLFYNVPMHKTDRLQRRQNLCAHILTKSPHREHITPI